MPDSAMEEPTNNLTGNCPSDHFSALFGVPACFRTQATSHAGILALRHQFLDMQRSNRAQMLRLGVAHRALWVWLPRLSVNIARVNASLNFLPPRRCGFSRLDGIIGRDKSNRSQPWDEYIGSS
jgi:hypothetical protein